MKKWMIIAVVAALFMVMFPACGGDDAGEDDTVASDVRAYKIGGNVLVTWTGSNGSDYAVYYQEKAATAVAGDGTKTQVVLGQRQFKFVLKDDGTGDVDTTINGDESYWSVWSDDAGKTGQEFSGNLPIGGEFRFGVGPALTGGFRSENLPIAWDNENLDSTAATAKGVDAKDYGFITF
jgi:hypothetical protein